MNLRPQKFSQLSRGCDNIEFYGLQRGQRVTLTGRRFSGQASATVQGTPPQGPGVYVATANGLQFLVDGEEIIEATKPSEG
jgi:hypothetical protein